MGKKRKPAAVVRYWDVALRESQALNRGLRAASTSRIPRDEYEAKEMMRDPFEQYEAAHAELLRASKSFRDGHYRKSGRPFKPKNSNDEVILLLKQHRASYFNGPLTLRRAIEIRLWLQRRSIYKTNDAITKMINRDKQRK